jgi:hypothetical protein
MIEINLIKKKKAFELPAVLGIDFNQINYRILVIAYLVTLCPDWLLKPKFAELQKVVTDQLKTEQTKLSKMKKEIGKNSNLEEQLDAFNKQIDKLKERSVQVEKIINSKTNPNKLLERIARSMPEDLWFTEIDISTENEILIKGQSSTYPSIGDFIQASNDTPFFGKSLILSDSGVVDEKNKNKEIRIEKFTIKGKVETFEPFRQDM